MSEPPFPADCAARFRKVSLLASGGFGAVFQAEQIALARPVAVKVLFGDALADPEQEARFADEARITASLAHPHVVRVVDHGAGTGVPWIAYELLPGQTLRARMTVPLPPADALPIARQVLQALDAAHARGIVHRDIKPENVLAAADGSWKVADFGIARWSSQRAVRTATGVVLGTPSYLAPEVIRGDAPGPPADIYAVGVMLFEMLTGSLPFQASNPLEVLQRHLQQPVPRLRDRTPGLSAALDSLVASALAKSPAERPTAADLDAQLSDIKTSPPSTAVPLVRAARGGASGTLRVACPPVPASSFSSRSLRIALAVALPAAALVAALALFHPTSPPAPLTPSSSSSPASPTASAPTPSSPHPNSASTDLSPIEIERLFIDLRGARGEGLEFGEPQMVLSLTDLARRCALHGRPSGFAYTPAEQLAVVRDFAARTRDIAQSVDREMPPAKGPAYPRRERLRAHAKRLEPEATATNLESLRQHSLDLEGFLLLVDQAPSERSLLLAAAAVTTVDICIGAFGDEDLRRRRAMGTRRTRPTDWITKLLAAMLDGALRQQSAEAAFSRMSEDAERRASRATGEEQAGAWLASMLSLRELAVLYRQGKRSGEESISSLRIVEALPDALRRRPDIHELDAWFRDSAQAAVDR